MIKKLKVLIAILFISLILLTTSSYAAIEIKSGTTPITSTTPSSVFSTAYDLRANSSTLGNNSLDPHLSLNSDWGIIAYLASSTYGCNGVTNTIATSTTGNESGVKDLGKSVSYVSSLYSNFTGVSGNRLNNLDNNRNTRYVEIIDNSYSGSEWSSVNKGRAFGETNSWLGGSTGWKYSIDINGAMSAYLWRNGVFGYATCSWSPYNKDSITWQSGTFRPVIWNI